MKNFVLARRLVAWLVMTTTLSLMAIAATFFVIIIVFGAVDLLFDTIRTWVEVLDAAWFIARIFLLIVWFMWALISAIGAFDRDFHVILDECWEALADWRNIKW